MGYIRVFSHRRRRKRGETMFKFVFPNYTLWNIWLFTLCVGFCQESVAYVRTLPHLPWKNIKNKKHTHISAISSSCTLLQTDLLLSEQRRILITDKTQNKLKVTVVDITSIKTKEVQKLVLGQKYETDTRQDQQSWKHPTLFPGKFHYPHLHDKELFSWQSGEMRE